MGHPISELLLYPVPERQYFSLDCGAERCGVPRERLIQEMHDQGERFVLAIDNVPYIDGNQLLNLRQQLRGNPPEKLSEGSRALRRGRLARLRDWIGARK